MAHPESLPNQKHFSKKHKNLIIVSCAIVIAVVVLISPIIPTQHTVTKTRTRNLRYSSKVYGQSIGLFVPKLVNVTNLDSIGGSFSVTMNMWYNPPLGQPQLKDTSTQSSSIPARATHAFYLPSNWIILEPMNSFTYSVSAPTTQESYQETQTEHKSILNLIASWLGV